MATKAHLIIDGRPNGLPSAVPYYSAFPVEPSPLGDLSLESTTVMADSSIEAVLDAIIRFGGDAFVLVCHAFQDGLLLPIAPEGRTAFGLVAHFQLIDQMIAAEEEAASIRKLPTSNEKETKIMFDRWEKLLNKLQPGAVTGTFTVKEAEDFFARFLEMVATKLEFAGKLRRDSMRRFIAKLQKVRTLKVPRLELRACDIGSDKVTMEVVRKFFGVVHLTAPKVGTFFIRALPVGLLPPFAQPERRRRGVAGVAGAATAPGPLGRNVILSGTILAQDNHIRAFFKRIFVPVELSVGPGQGAHLGAIQSFYSFFVAVEKLTVVSFQAAATVISTGTGVTPDWAVVRRFVQEFIMPASRYSTGSFPLAGLWSPDTPDQPFALPQETLYIRLIEEVS